jgi:hypothetical protein
MLSAQAVDDIESEMIDSSENNNTKRKSKNIESKPNRLQIQEVTALFHKIKASRELSSELERVLLEMKELRLIRSLPNLVSMLANDASCRRRLTHADLMKLFDIVAYAPSRSMSIIPQLIDLGLDVDLTMWTTIMKTIGMVYKPDFNNYKRGYDQYRDAGKLGLFRSDLKPKDYFDDHGTHMSKFLDILSECLVIVPQECYVIALKHFIAVQQYSKVHQVIVQMDNLYGTDTKAYYFEGIVDELVNADEDFLRISSRPSSALSSNDFEKYSLLLDLCRRMHRRTVYRHSRYVTVCLFLHLHFAKAGNRRQIQQAAVNGSAMSYLDEAYEVALDANRNNINIGYYVQEALVRELSWSKRIADIERVLSQFQSTFINDLRTFTRVFILWRNHGHIEQAYKTLHRAISYGLEPNATMLKIVLDLDMVNVAVAKEEVSTVISTAHDAGKLKSLVPFYSAVVCLAEAKAYELAWKVYEENINDLLSQYRPENQEMVQLLSIEPIDRYMLNQVLAIFIRQAIRQDAGTSLLLREKEQLDLSTEKTTMVDLVDQQRCPIIFRCITSLMKHFPSTSVDDVLQEELLLQTIATEYDSKELLKNLNNQLLYRDKYWKISSINTAIQVVKSYEDSRYMNTIRNILVTYMRVQRPTIKTYSELIRWLDDRKDLQTLLQFGWHVANFILDHRNPSLISNEKKYPSLYLLLCCLDRLAPVMKAGQRKVIADYESFRVGYRIIAAIKHMNGVVPSSTLSSLLLQAFDLLSEKKLIFPKILTILESIFIHDKPRVFPYATVRAILDYTDKYHHHIWLVRLFEIQPSSMILHCLTIDHLEPLLSTVYKQEKYSFLIDVFREAASFHTSLGMHLASSTYFWSLCIQSFAKLKTSTLVEDINSSFHDCTGILKAKGLLMDSELISSLANQLMEHKLYFECSSLVKATILHQDEGKRKLNVFQEKSDGSCIRMIASPDMMIKLSEIVQTSQAMVKTDDNLSLETKTKLQAAFSAQLKEITSVMKKSAAC